MTGFFRQIGGRLAHVELAGDHVGDEARAVLAEELDLATGTAHCGVDVGSGLVEVIDDGGLFGEWWERNVNRPNAALRKAIPCYTLRLDMELA